MLKKLFLYPMKQNMLHNIYKNIKTNTGKYQRSKIKKREQIVFL